MTMPLLSLLCCSCLSPSFSYLSSSTSSANGLSRRWLERFWHREQPVSSSLNNNILLASPAIHLLMVFLVGSCSGGSAPVE
ncbi:hypothetical protein DL96DRAFT_128453 [Flagelloscypha sp. PMI_526]|nr:hypothetical protein DL96DRAFT_128453 [Flagelloscypha sp. PMI_526]